MVTVGIMESLQATIIAVVMLVGVFVYKDPKSNKDSSSKSGSSSSGEVS